MIFFYSFLIFSLGACLGSFANVCIYRLPKNKQIVSGRSFCPKCKKKINWYDNLPLISFIILNNKCRNCKRVISSRYFIVELITGISFLLIYLNFKNPYTIIFLSILSLILIMIFFIDLENFIIPDSLNFIVMGLALLKNFLPNFDTSLIHEINQSIIGGMVGYLSIWLIIYLYKTFKKIDGMGFGDAKLMAGIGLLFGWQSIPFILFVSSILGLIFVVPSLIKKQKTMRTEIPFGPFIIAACLIYFAQGDLLYSLILV
ncbi:A24 family peptidase [uncultured Candidatus Pelagibacter sp.]|uniref:prepilin peptidase n=1 Tax=uncultured Candidatus Pelagibacter sp. TaxID=372654 RepID=UPI00261815B5|nr:A24 family peptidase [uncultured Candidatus Pelagibacter sp.]